MYRILLSLVIIIQMDFVVISLRNIDDEDLSAIDVFDLTNPTTWREFDEYYSAVDKNWKICINCGIPGLGTGIHLEHTGASGSMQPAMIPTEYLLTRLEVIDVSYIAKMELDLTLSLDVALQWPILKQDPKEPTLILFKFGWTDTNLKRKCVCKIPGLSYELAEWIAANLSHVVGVATDAPTLESDQTREMTSRTVSNVLGKSGVYMIENVNLRRRLPEHGCITITMPLKMLGASYVPTRLTALCPTHSDGFVNIALKKGSHTQTDSRDYRNTHGSSTHLPRSEQAFLDIDGEESACVSLKAIKIFKKQ